MKPDLLAEAGASVPPESRNSKSKEQRMPIFKSPRRIPIGVSWSEVWEMQEEMFRRRPFRPAGRPGPEPDARDAGAAFLAKLLEDRAEVLAVEGLDLARLEGISERTLRREKSALGIKSRMRKVKDGEWRWTWVKPLEEKRGKA